MANLNGPNLGANSRSLDMYLAHTEFGQTLRDIGRLYDVNPSTVLRCVRRIEERRDDPLVDEAIKNIARKRHDRSILTKDHCHMQTQRQKKPTVLSKPEVRILRRLSEKGAFLAVSQQVEKAMVFRDAQGGEPIKTAVVEKHLAQSLVLRDFIRSDSTLEKINRYRITDVGRAALKRTISGDQTNQGFAEQHREWGTRQISEENDGVQKLRVNLRESPIAMLSRKKDPNGQVFLSADLVDAGERLREDFELAQLGPRITQNWDRFVNGGDRGAFSSAGEGGSAAAQRRLAEALGALGQGLGDIALRCCCYLEGLETAEKRMGWSARSGKIVLRIALQRLRLHYDGTLKTSDQMIG